MKEHERGGKSAKRWPDLPPPTAAGDVVSWVEVEVGVQKNWETLQDYLPTISGSSGVGPC